MTSFALNSASQEHYVESLKVFQTKTNELAKINDILRDHMPSLIQRMLPLCQQQSRLNVLSVGSGTGEVDMEIVKIIEEKIRKNKYCHQIQIYNRAIEPNECACGIYKAAIKNLPKSLADQQIYFDIHQQTFEEYKERRNEPTKFDIIHFIHSIYYVDIEQTLIHCFENELNVKGYVICILTRKDLMYWVLMKQRRRWQGKTGDNKSLEAADRIVEVAAEKGWKCEVYSQEYLIDVTEVFDVKSIDGNLLLDFLTHTTNFRETADKQLLEETLTLIKNLTIVKDGKRFGEKQESLVIIYR